MARTNDLSVQVEASPARGPCLFGDFIMIVMMVMKASGHAGVGCHDCVSGSRV